MARIRIDKLSAATLAMLALILRISPVTAAPVLEVRDVWVHATVPGQSVAAGYMTLRSRVALRVVAVHSNVSDAADFHTMSLEGGVMRMRRLEALSVPPDHAVTLAPGGIHLMLAGLRRTLKEGDTVELELATRDGGGRNDTIHVRAPVLGEAPQ